MAKITYGNNSSIIDFDDHQAIVPDSYIVINPSAVSEAKRAWVCQLRFRAEGLPTNSVWLDDAPFFDPKIDTKLVRAAYFDAVDATDNDRAPFYRWDDLSSLWLSGDHSQELADEINRRMDFNDFGMFPICSGSVVSVFYRSKSEDGVNDASE